MSKSLSQRWWRYAVSLEEQTTAQTRELECTKIVFPEVIARGIHMCTCTGMHIKLLVLFRTESSRSCP